MLTSMRKNSKFLNVSLWIVIFAFLATIFVVWGFGEKRTDNFIVRIGDYVVTPAEYQERERLFRNNFPSIPNEQLKSLVVENIITEHIFLKEADALGIIVSDDEVINAIVNNSYFQENGVFDKEKYASMVNMASYENSVRDEIKFNKMRNFIINSVAVTEEEILNEFNYQYTKLNAEEFAIDIKRFTPKEAPSDAELEEFYNNNQELYRKPAEVKIKYIKFSNNDFDFKPEITDEMLLAQYNNNINEYVTPDSLDLSNILIRINDVNNESEVQMAEEKANKAYEELKKGVKFKDVAVKYSDDPSVKETGGFIGNVFIPNIPLSDDIAPIFALKANEYTKVLRIGDNFEIYKADKYIKGKNETFESVKSKLKSEIIEKERANAYNSYLYGLYRDFLTASNITAYMKKNPNSFKVVITDFMPEDSKNRFIANDNIRKALFSTSKTDITPIIKFEDGDYLFEVVDKIDSTIPPIGEVKNKVTEGFKASAALQAALKDLNENVPSEPISSADFGNIAKKYKANVTKIKPFTIIDGSFENSWGEDIVKLLFNKDEGTVLLYPLPMDNIIHVVHVKEKTLPAPNELNSAKALIETELLSKKRNAAYTSVYNNLYNKYKIELNSDFFK